MRMNIKINLSNLISAVRYEKGESGHVECLIIPIDKNHLFRGKSGVYLDLTAFDLKEERDGQTHLIKQSLPKEVYQKMSEEEKYAAPIIGSVSIPQQQTETVSSTEVLPPETDLPF